MNIQVTWVGKVLKVRWDDSADRLVQMVLNPSIEEGWMRLIEFPYTHPLLPANLQYLRKSGVSIKMTARVSEHLAVMSSLAQQERIVAERSRIARMPVRGSKQREKKNEAFGLLVRQLESMLTESAV